MIWFFCFLLFVLACFISDFFAVIFCLLYIGIFGDSDLNCILFPVFTFSLGDNPLDCFWSLYIINSNVPVFISAYSFFFPKLQTRLLAQASMGLSCMYLSLNLSELNAIPVASLSTLASLRKCSLSQWVASQMLTSDFWGPFFALSHSTLSIPAFTTSCPQSINQPQSFFPIGITTCHAVIISVALL